MMLSNGKKRRPLGVKWKLFAYLSAFVALTLVLLWFFQVVFLQDFYKAIKINKVKISVYVFSSVCAAMAGIIMTSQLRAAHPATGESWEMNAIASVVLGGTSMSGGRGSLVGAFLGMLIIGVMNNILNTVGVPTFLCDAVKGLIIIFAVLLQKKESA